MAGRESETHSVACIMTMHRAGRYRVRISVKVKGSLHLAPSLLLKWEPGLLPQG